jgi:hypothetical protein
MRSRQIALVTAFAWLAVLALAAQDKVDVAPPPSARFPAAWYPPDNNVSYRGAPVTGAPYTARLVQHSEMDGGAALSAGAARDRPMQARDSAGRMRSETPEIRLKDGKPVAVRSVRVDDPVSHCSFEWREPWVDTGAPTASVQCMTRTLHLNDQPAMWSVVASTKAGQEHPSPNETDVTEAMGERTFDGVRAVGLRRVTTVKGASPQQTQIIDSEMWSAPAMKEIVAIYVKGAMGYSIELEEIQLREPDGGLFYPPTDYRIEPLSNHP